MSYLFFLTAVLGAMGLYLILPHPRSAPRLGALLALIALGGSLLIWFLPEPAARPDVYYYLFTLIAAAAGVRVISHPRPVYSALYFVIVVLSSVGMLVLLEAEFMAFAMLIIYGGAILVTYMFVIMLATLPQSAAAPETGTQYDLAAREPLLSVVMGMLLVAGLSAAIFEQADRPVQANYPVSIAESATDMPGKVALDELTAILRAHHLIDDNERVFDEDDLAFDAAAHTVTVSVRRERADDPNTPSGARARLIELDDDVLNRFIHNIDHVGLALFKGHMLGIELAAVILLLAMVGAIVIAKRHVPEPEPESTPG